MEKKQKNHNSKNIVKKESIKEEEEEIAKPKANRDKEVIWVLIVMGVLLAVVLLTYYFVQSSKHFNYEGLTFTKELFGKIPVYHYSYYFNDSTGKLYQYNLFLRNDPRSNEVPVSGDPILFSAGRFTYVSINSTGLKECDNSSIAIAGLASFFADNKLNVKGATPDKEEALNKSLRYVTCAIDSDDNVVEIFVGNQTKITNKGNCHKIEVSDCQILQATEKFVTQTVIDAKNSANNA